MKNERSRVSARKEAAGGEAGDFPLPDPMELAQLAAILRRDTPGSPDAFKAAVKCYFEAVLFVRERAASEITALLAKKQKAEEQNAMMEQKAERQKKAIEDIKKADAWADTVTLVERGTFSPILAGLPKGFANFQKKGSPRCRRQRARRLRRRCTRSLSFT
jgi:hypothetical protein